MQDRRIKKLWGTDGSSLRSFKLQNAPAIVHLKYKRKFRKTFHVKSLFLNVVVKLKWI